MWVRPERRLGVTEQPVRRSVLRPLVVLAYFRGHCIRLEVSSSRFPRHDRNASSGSVTADTSPDEAGSATNRICTYPRTRAAWTRR